MAQYEFFLASSLEKVFPSRRPAAMEAGAALSGWPGTRLAAQLVYWADRKAQGTWSPEFTVTVSGGPGQAKLRRVELIPSDFPCYETADEFYITREPGLFPDLLQPMEAPVVKPLHSQYRSLWISWDIPECCPAGSYPVTVTAQGTSGLVFENRLSLRVGSKPLPEQKLLHTQWFHADCLANYYDTAPWSEKHWEIVENFIHTAHRDCCVNLLLTPVFTPPLDTAVGGARRTVQLVDVNRNGEAYVFSFEKLKKWAEIAKNAGIKNLEIAHLFTQWGAAAAPKIMATVDGEYRQLFGWDTAADGPEYRKFLEAFLPALQKTLAELGYDRDHVYYHISDEPSAGQLEAYRAARAQAVDLLSGCRIMDAMSDLDFYREGLTETPVVACDALTPFLEAGVENLWTYYCCAQGAQVPNRFFAMESARNRILGVLLYRHRIRGFLHWGYNFYNSQYSRRPIDPYRVTHGDYAFPSGDAFLVYPGPGGQALCSIRGEVLCEGLTDLRALTQLENLRGRAAAEALLTELSCESQLTFRDYPRDAAFLLNLRERLFDAIENAP